MLLKLRDNIVYFPLLLECLFINFLPYPMSGVYGVV